MRRELLIRPPFLSLNADLMISPLNEERYDTFYFFMPHNSSGIGVHLYLIPAVIWVSLWSGDKLIDGRSEDPVACVENHHQSQYYRPVVVGEMLLQILSARCSIIPLYLFSAAARRCTGLPLLHANIILDWLMSNTNATAGRSTVVSRARPSRGEREGLVGIVLYTATQNRMAITS